MDIALIVLAIVFLMAGIVGSVVPGLPGPPLSWVGLLLAYMCSWTEISVGLLIVAVLFAIAITIFDYILPSLSTRRFGGSKAGTWGCNIGLVVSMIGLPFGPTGILGVVFWPFVGAFIGEIINGAKAKAAIKAAFGSFLGFLSGTLLKVMYCLALLIIVIASLF